MLELNFCMSMMFAFTFCALARSMNLPFMFPDDHERVNVLNRISALLLEINNL